GYRGRDIRRSSEITGYAGHENAGEKSITGCGVKTPALVDAEKQKDLEKKKEAGKETQHGEHAWYEYAGNAQAHAAKEAECEKKAVNNKTSNGQHAGDEDASG